jgi:hypothetical protein
MLHDGRHRLLTFTVGPYLPICPKEATPLPSAGLFNAMDECRANGRRHVPCSINTGDPPQSPWPLYEVLECPLHSTGTSIVLNLSWGILETRQDGTTVNLVFVGRVRAWWCASMSDPMLQSQRTGEKR